MKIFKYSLLLLLLVLGDFFDLNAQVDGIRIKTPEILDGAITNDVYYHGGLVIGTTYTGDPPFKGWDREAYYSLDGGAAWETANRKELPSSSRLDFTTNSFSGSGFQTDEINMYRVSSNISQETSRAPIISVGIYVKSDYNAVDMAVLDDGNFVAAWRNTTAQGNDNIYCQVFDNQGNKIGNEYLVRSQKGQSVFFPKAGITSLENGNFIITWENHTSTSSYPRAKVLAVIFRYSNGNILERNSIELNAVTGRHNLAAAIIPTTGGFTAFTRQWWWTDNRYFHSGFYGRKYDINGYATGSLFNIAATNSSNTEISNSPPRILTLKDGSPVFIWEERPAQLFIQRLNTGFTQIGSRIKAADIKEQTWTASVSSDNGFFLGWKQNSGDNLIGQFFSVNGNTDGQSFLINELPNTEAYSPCSGEYKEGGFALSWLQYNFDIQSYQVNIRKYYPDKQYHKVEYLPEYWAWNYNFHILQGTDCVATYLNHEDDRDFLLFSGHKSLQSDLLHPRRDIDIQCKLVDSLTGQEWISPIRSYLYADPEDGMGSIISYDDGFSNKSQVNVKFDIRNGRYKSLEFYLQKAALADSQWGAFGEWEAYGSVSTLTREINVDLENGYSYRFKYIITNMADKTYEITSNHILSCDTTPPILDILSTQLEQSKLHLTLAYSDGGSGINRMTGKVNNEPETTIDAAELVLELSSGPNHIKLEIVDKAGNSTIKHIFQIVEVVEPEIYLFGIEDQAEYGDELVFRFETNTPLTNTGVYMDGTLVEAADPGRIVLNLGGYPEGGHKIAVKGEDSRGHTVEKSINITLTHNTFSLVLLSPAAKEYGNRNISIEFWAGAPLSEIWYQLDGGEKETDLLMTDLPDGSHELTLSAFSEGGILKSCTTVFSVREVFPVLNVLSPVNGGVYPDKSVDVVFDTNSDIQYEIGDETGEVYSNQKITVNEDGGYELVLIATHPVSGNVIRKSVTFTIDSIQPQVEIISPESRLYAYNEINIDYRVNKSEYGIAQYLNGEEVDTLQNLEPGPYSFEIRVSDRSGRTGVKRVDFQVVEMAILSPEDGEKILSGEYPCIVPFSYNREGWYGPLTRALDNREGSLITSPPGVIIPLETEAGNHELHLRGYMNEFAIARKAGFQIGRKNLTAGPGSIGYSYETPGAGDEYKVTVNVNINNSGDLDIEAPVVIRFDSISRKGTTATYWEEIEGIPAKKTALITLDNIIAHFGDMFMVTIDPDKELKGEDPTDNFRKIEFQTGQITGVTGALSNGNVYVSEVSVWDEIDVDTAGPIAYVEIHAGDKIFIDNTPGGGFHLIVDLGLLTPERNYLQILAYGSNGVVLDSRKKYYDINILPEQMGRYDFPWSHFASEDYNDFDHVIMDETDLKKLYNLRNDLVLTALSHPPCIIPQIEKNQKVTYRILSVASDTGQTDSKEINDDVEVEIPVGEYERIGGRKKMPTGKGFITEYSFDPVAKSCTFLSTTPLLSLGSEADYRDILQEAWEKVTNSMDVALFDKLGLENFFYENTIDKVSVADRGSMVAYRSIDNINDLKWDEHFESEGCFICNVLGKKEIEFDSYGIYTAEATGSYNITIGKEVSDSDNNDFIIPFIFSSSRSNNYYVQNIPIDFTFSINAAFEKRNDGDYLNPVISRLRQKTRKPQKRPLFDLQTANWSFLGGFLGSSTSYHARYFFSTKVNADVVTVTNWRSDPISLVTNVYSYAGGDLSYTIKKKWRRCFIWICRSGESTVLDKQQHASVGEDYDEETINATIIEFIDSYKN